MILNSKIVTEVTEEENILNKDFNVHLNNNYLVATTSTYRFCMSASASETDEEVRYNIAPTVSTDLSSPQGSVDCEIVGLHHNSNGQSCTVHKTCG